MIGEENKMGTFIDPLLNEIDKLKEVKKEQRQLIENLLFDNEKLKEKCEYNYQCGYQNGYSEGYRKSIEYTVQYEYFKPPAPIFIVTSEDEKERILKSFNNGGKINNGRL